MGKSKWPLVEAGKHRCFGFLVTRTQCRRVAAVVVGSELPVGVETVVAGTAGVVVVGTAGVVVVKAQGRTGCRMRRTSCM